MKNVSDRVIRDYRTHNFDKYLEMKSTDDRKFRLSEKIGNVKIDNEEEEEEEEEEEG